MESITTCKYTSMRTCHSSAYDRQAAWPVDPCYMHMAQEVMRTPRARVQVTAGTVVYEAPLSLRASATGASSTLAGIGRLVAAAQARWQPLAQAHPLLSGYKRGAMLMPVTQHKAALETSVLPVQSMHT